MPTPQLDIFAGMDGWQQAAIARQRQFAAESAAEQALRPSLAAGVDGWCSMCAAPRRFFCPELAAGGATAETLPLRESLHCRQCRCNARQRAAMAVLQDAMPDIDERRLYLSEHASSMYLATRRRVRRVSGSEYAGRLRRLRLSAWLWRHGVPEWVRHADITALPFAPGGLDAILSLDVLEHVFDYRTALGEFARVLRPGGCCVLTVPFYCGQARSEVLAQVDGKGCIRHLKTPEYHGDPLGGGGFGQRGHGRGVLCFHHFGWDLLDAIRAAGFRSAEAVRIGDPAFALPQPQWVLRATR